MSKLRESNSLLLTFYNIYGLLGFLVRLRHDDKNKSLPYWKKSSK